MRSIRVNQRWYDLARMSELTEYLQSIPSHELTKKVATEISEEHILENPRKMVVENFILLSKQFMSQFYEEIRPDLERHSLEYPFVGLRIPFLTYESTGGRSSYQRFQSGLRGIPRLGKRYSPRRIVNPVLPIVLPGVDYSAERLVPLPHCRASSFRTRPSWVGSTWPLTRI